MSWALLACVRICVAERKRLCVRQQSNIRAVVTKEWKSGAAPLLLFSLFSLMWYKECNKTSKNLFDLSTAILV